MCINIINALDKLYWFNHMQSSVAHLFNLGPSRVKISPIVVHKKLPGLGEIQHSHIPHVKHDLFVDAFFQLPGTARTS